MDQFTMFLNGEPEETVVRRSQDSSATMKRFGPTIAE